MFVSSTRCDSLTRGGDAPATPPPPPQTPDLQDWYDAPAAAEPGLIAAALELANVQEQADEPPAPPPRAAGYILLNGHEFRKKPPTTLIFPT